VQTNRAVSGVNRKGLSAAIHLAMNLRIAELTFDRNRNAEADPAIVCAGINVRIQIAGKCQINAAVTGSNPPRTGHFRTRMRMRVDTSIAGLDIQRVKPPIQRDVPISRIGVNLAVQVAPFNAAIASAKLDLALGASDADAPIARMNIQVALN